MIPLIPLQREEDTILLTVVGTLLLQENQMLMPLLLVVARSLLQREMCLWIAVAGSWILFWAVKSRILSGAAV